MISRRHINQALLATGALWMAGEAGRARADGQTMVAKTRQGKVQGIAQDGVTRFYGIPYGDSTAGQRRFMPPRPATPWADVRPAVEFGPSCPQVSLGVSPFAKKQAANAPPPPPTDMQRKLGSLFTRRKPEPPMAEDCLVLNVWTPALDQEARPVMVWLHGGGFAVGSGSEPGYDGTRLAKRGDVVVVTINHRLNVFGHLYLGEIAGSEFQESGNVGMLDIVEALKWVRDNIENFGGDPHRVTIFGESGGAGKVSVICGLPAAKGLFHRAIMQSGPCLQISDKARGTEIARQLLKDLNLSNGDVRALQSMSALDLARAADAAEVKVVPRVLGFGPSGMVPLVDGVSITHHPFDTTAAPESGDVPFMVGSTKDEATLFAGPLPGFGTLTADQVKEYLQPMAGARTNAAYDLYARLYPSDTPSYLLVDAVTDFWMREAANHVAALKARQNKRPAYVYVLEWPIDPQLRTPHGTDVYLSFDNVQVSPAIAAAPGAQTVADQMADTWIAFARTGNPNNRSIPQWAAYDLKDRTNLLFNTQSRAVKDYGRDTREFWEKA
jgi:para-nitrobenzyl esterase